MAGARRDEHRERILALDAEAMDRHIGGAILRIGAHGKAHRDIGPSILRRVRRRRHELSQVEARLVCTVDLLLTVDMCTFLDHLRGNRVLELLCHLDAQMLCIEPRRLATRFLLARRPIATRASSKPFT